jgi:hypothetical protein
MSICSKKVFARAERKKRPGKIKMFALLKPEGVPLIKTI